MSAGENRTHSAPTALLARARTIGLLGAVLFGLASVAVIDGLQTLMRHDFNRLDLIPGEVVAVSGNMPRNAQSIGDLQYVFEGETGLRFTPKEAFKGFWFGGQMWRGNLSVPADAKPGRAVLTIVDLVPAKRVGDANATQSATVQNPMLVNQIRIFADAAARRAEDPSYIYRFFRLPPFAVAVFFAVLAFAACLTHWLLFGRAERALTADGTYFIHGVKPDSAGAIVAFAHVGHDGFAPGDPVRLLDAKGRARARGTITEKNRHKGFAQFPPLGMQPRYGDLIAIETGGENIRRRAP